MSTMRRVDQLKVGMLVDLENDIFAKQISEECGFEFEYEVVDYIEQEAPNCIRVDFRSGRSFGFPPDHIVTIDPDNRGE